MKPNIYNYFEAKEFLKELYAYLKNRDRKVNYRVLCNKAGIKSTAHLTHILSGKMRITEKVIPKLTLAFGLNISQTEYFKILVLYNQSKTHQKKAQYFEMLINLKKYFPL